MGSRGQACGGGESAGQPERRARLPWSLMSLAATRLPWSMKRGNHAGHEEPEAGIRHAFELGARFRLCRRSLTSARFETLRIGLRTVRSRADYLTEPRSHEDTGERDWDVARRPCRPVAAGTGPGLLETVCKVTVVARQGKRGLSVARQVPISIE